MITVHQSSSMKICIFGTGGFGREVLFCLMDSLNIENETLMNDICFMVDDEHYCETEVNGVPVIRKSEFDIERHTMIIAIGDSSTRKKIVDSFPQHTKYTTIIHPSAVISKWVEIGPGSIVTAGCILTCNIKIGAHAQINLHTTIGHDCKIGDYFTTAPASNVSGSCIIGNQVYLGTNSTIKQGITLADNIIVGMGGVVVKDITEPGIYIGNPIKKLDK